MKSVFIHIPKISDTSTSNKIIADFYHITLVHFPIHIEMYNKEWCTSSLFHGIDGILRYPKELAFFLEHPHVDVQWTPQHPVALVVEQNIRETLSVPIKEILPPLLFVISVPCPLFTQQCARKSCQRPFECFVYFPAHVQDHSFRLNRGHIFAFPFPQYRGGYFVDGFSQKLLHYVIVSSTLGVQLFETAVGIQVFIIVKAFPFW